MLLRSPVNFCVRRLALLGALALAWDASIPNAAAGLERSDSAFSTTAQQFLGKVTALVAADRGGVTERVAEAVQHRPDLAPRIVVAAITVVIEPQKSPLRRAEILWITKVVAAAVSAAPGSAAAILVAAIELQPAAREQIVAAAVSAAPQGKAEILAAAASVHGPSFAWLDTSADNESASGGGVGMLNPANLDSRDDKKIRSPEKKPKPPRGL